MAYDKYILCTNDGLEIKKSDSYLKLFFHIFAGDVTSTAKTIKNLDNIMDTLLNGLGDKEKNVLIQRYGLSGDVPKTLCETGALYGFTGERARQIEEKAKRKLRHPSRSRYLRGYLNAPNFGIGYGCIDYEGKCKTLLKEEIKNVVEHGGSNTIYLEAIKKKNNIALFKESYTAINDDASVEDLDFSVRTSNCLKRSGILTVGELRSLKYDELSQIRNLRSYEIEEIQIKLSEIKTYDDQYNTIVFINNYEKTVFKYLDDDVDKITDSLFEMIFDKREKGKKIFSCSFSPGLMDILLMKGYLYEYDVYEDSDDLELQFINFGFPQYGKEIQVLKKCHSEGFGPNEVVYLDASNEVVMEFIENNNGCTSLADLRKLAEEKNNQKVIEFVDYVISEKLT